MPISSLTTNVGQCPTTVWNCRKISYCVPTSEEKIFTNLFPESNSRFTRKERLNPKLSQTNRLFHLLIQSFCSLYFIMVVKNLPCGQIAVRRSPEKSLASGTFAGPAVLPDSNYDLWTILDVCGLFTGSLNWKG